MSAAQRGRPAEESPERNGPNVVRLDPESLEAVAGRVAALLGGAPAPEGALLDAEGAAALLGVPASWVLQEARADRIPHVRLGRYVRFERLDLEDWWRASARGPRRRAGARPVPDRREAR